MGLLEGSLYMIQFTDNTVTVGILDEDHSDRVQIINEEGQVELLERRFIKRYVLKEGFLEDPDNAIAVSDSNGDPQ